MFPFFEFLADNGFTQPARNLKEENPMKFWRTPLDSEKIHIRRGTVTIIEERCKGCEFCIEYCPRNVLKMSSAFNVKGYHFPFIEDSRALRELSFLRGALS